MSRCFEDVLGEARAAHCAIKGFRGGHLVVEIDSAPLFAELSGFEKDEIRLAMNARMEKRKVGKITFRMGGTGHV